MSRSNWQRCIRWGRWLPALFLVRQVGCLPEQSFQQVFGENIVLTAAVVIQSITSIFFKTLFGVI